MAANKPSTFLHISLIISVMLFIIATAVAYMNIDDARELRASLQEAKSDQEKQKTIARGYSEQVDALKKKIGHEHPEVGLNAAAPEPADPNAPQQAPNSVLGSMESDIENYNVRGPGVPAPPDYKTTLRELREALQTAQDNYAKEQAVNQQHNANIATLKDDYDKKEKAHDAARAAAVQAKMDAETEHNQALQVVRDQYTKLEGEHQKLKVAMQEAQNAHDQVLAEKDDRIARLVSINDILQDRIKNATRTSFERPDGIVQWVDNSSKLVWINLGSADNLTVRTNFSVYKQSNRGVGVDSENTLKGPEDLKGSIEVTNIVGPHLAQARILDENIYNPISQGDPIYTPIWSPNQRESFAFVGLIDLDDDGRSDRELLHDVLAAANATVQIEVDDEGNRTGGGSIDERTKFLVVGQIPALEDLADQKEIEAAKKIHAEHKALKDEAREQGVRVVTLNDFMAFIGYTPRQRVFRPGDQRPFTLTSGSRSTATSQTAGQNRVSSGNTAGIYSRSKRLRQPTGTGQTSGAFRGSR